MSNAEDETGEGYELQKLYCPTHDILYFGEIIYELKLSGKWVTAENNKKQYTFNIRTGEMNLEEKTN